MKKSFFFAAALLTLAACTKTPTYNVKATFSDPELNDQTAYFIDFDTNEPIDSVVIAEGVAQFSGEITEPFYAMIKVGENRPSYFFVEADSIFVNDGVATGGELNQRFNDFMNARNEIVKAFRELPDSLRETKGKELANQMNTLSEQFNNDNADNTIGFINFIQGDANYMTTAQIDSVIAARPAYASSKRIANIKERLVKVEETSAGKKFKDFEITYNDSTFRLSDHVGKGHPVVVDFWASWCGPCIRQGEVLKEIYKEYADKGLEIIGVAVWDEPENTVKAVADHGYPWEIVLNGQHIPSDLYGFNGIPCIIVFDAEGTIVSRDKQSDALRADIATVMELAK